MIADSGGLQAAPPLTQTSAGLTLRGEDGHMHICQLEKVISCCVTVVNICCSLFIFCEERR